MIGFDTGINLWRVYIWELSWDPHFFVLENKSIFIVAGTCANNMRTKGNRKVHGVPQSQTAALPRLQEEEETDKSKQAQNEQTYKKH